MFTMQRVEQPQFSLGHKLPACNISLPRFYNRLAWYAYPLRAVMLQLFRSKMEYESDIIDFNKALFEEQRYSLSRSNL